MEVLFYFIFGSLLLFFIGYALWLHKQDKKILDEYKDQTDGRLLDCRDISEEEMGIQFSEQPTFDCYKSAN